MKHKTIRIEINIEDGDQNVGCGFYDGEKQINFLEFTEEEKYKVVDVLSGFAQLFNRGL